MNRDFDLQQKVIDALVAEPGIDPADIGVTVVDGVVSLHGFVGSYAEKQSAEQVAQRTSGVEAIAEELRVRHADDAKTADHEIAKRIGDIFRWNPLVPDHGVMIKVEGAAVTLSGRVPLPAQRDEAAKAAAQVSGVLTVANRIEVGPDEPHEITQTAEASSWEPAEPEAGSVEAHQGQIGW